MAQRFYLPSTGDPPYYPAYTDWYSEWEGPTFPSDYKGRLAVRSKISSAFTTFQSTLSGTWPSAPDDVKNSRYVTEPIAAQTITGTVKGQIGAREYSSGYDACRALVIRVMSGDCSTERGVALAHFPGSLVSEFNAGTDESARRNRYFPPSGTSLSDVGAQAGDRLVFEFGARYFTSGIGSRPNFLRFGDNSETDLPEDESDANDYCPWIEFSMDINFGLVSTGPVFMYDYRRRRN